MTIVLIQKVYRGFIFRKKRLPLILYIIQKYLTNQNIIINTNNNDGRQNSIYDENIILKLLLKKYNNKIIIPKCRMWYDFLILDNIYGYIPVNIKSTTMKNADNIGNLTMCVYTYTNYPINLYKIYKNGKLSKILLNELKNKNYNTNNNDYYFIVINKNNTNDIIINSLIGLSNLTSNSNNLPFQIRWKNNRNYNYDYKINKIKLFIKCLYNTKLNWQTNFLNEIKKLNIT